MMKSVEALIAGIAIALVAASRAKPAEEHVDRPKEFKTRVAEQPTTEKPQPAGVDIWTAAARGDLEAIKEHVAAGVDMNAKAPSIGVRPLMAAALTGQSDTATLLLLAKAPRRPLRRRPY